MSTPNTEIALIGIDIGRNSCHVVGQCIRALIGAVCCGLSWISARVRSD